MSQCILTDPVLTNIIWAIYSWYMYMICLFIFSNLT